MEVLALKNNISQQVTNMFKAICRPTMTKTSNFEFKDLPDVFTSLKKEFTVYDSEDEEENKVGK